MTYESKIRHTHAPPDDCGQFRRLGLPEVRLLAVIATLSKGYDLDYIWKQVDPGLVKDAAGYYIQAMEEQLSRLARVAGDSGDITVQVLSFDAGAHAAAGDGSFAVLQFAETEDMGLVHLGGIGGGVCLEGQDDIAAYTQAFEQLRTSTFSPAQSALLLRGMAGA